MGKGTGTGMGTKKVCIQCQGDFESKSEIKIFRLALERDEILSLSMRRAADAFRRRPRVGLSLLRPGGDRPCEAKEEKSKQREAQSLRSEELARLVRTFLALRSSRLELLRALERWRLLRPGRGPFLVGGMDYLAKMATDVDELIRGEAAGGPTGGEWSIPWVSNSAGGILLFYPCAPSEGGRRRPGEGAVGARSSRHRAAAEGALGRYWTSGSAVQVDHREQ